MSKNYCRVSHLILLMPELVDAIFFSGHFLVHDKGLNGIMDDF
jgi:hypothetical protein